MKTVTLNFETTPFIFSTVTAGLSATRICNIDRVTNGLGLATISPGTMLGDRQTQDRPWLVVSCCQRAVHESS